VVRQGSMKPMPGAVDRVLLYVGYLFFLCLASTVAWWAGARVAKTEFQSMTSALACSMRIFFYSICLLCILVLLRSFNWAPEDPQSTLFSWIHIGGTIWIVVPSAWRAFHDRRPRLVVALLIGGLLTAGGIVAGMALSSDFRWVIENFPRFLTVA